MSGDASHAGHRPGPDATGRLQALDALLKEKQISCDEYTLECASLFWALAAQRDQLAGEKRDGAEEAERGVQSV
jgi:hypothetical protein